MAFCVAGDDADDDDADDDDNDDDDADDNNNNADDDVGRWRGRGGFFLFRGWRRLFRRSTRHKTGPFSLHKL